MTEMSMGMIEATGSLATRRRRNPLQRPLDVHDREEHTVVGTKAAVGQQEWTNGYGA